VAGSTATPSRIRRLLPLVLATTATQASIVVLAPLLVEIGNTLDASVSAVGGARSVLAGTAVATSLAVGPVIDRVGVRPLIIWGALLALGGAVASGAAPALPVFYAAHVITGLGVGCLLSAGFAGVASNFDPRDMTWAMGYVVGAQSLAWILGNPIVGLLADAGSWRLAYAVPASICVAALVAGLLSRPTEGKVAASGEPDTIRDGLVAVYSDRSARRWAIAELVGYSAWAAELTYAAAYYIREYDVNVATIGVLLAGGSVVFLTVSLNVNRLMVRYSRRRLIVISALGMGVTLALFLNWAPSVIGTFLMFCVMAVFAAIRVNGSSALGLEQLPERPGAMMGARTAAAQLGYMVGAGGGGIVLALWGFGALGFVLFAGMAASAWLVAGVRDPWIEGGPSVAERFPEPIPD
jgi:predicted MFS family arabinose efflux permease